MEPQPQSRFRKAIDAVNLKRGKDDPSILVAIGKIFWAQKKPVKARMCFKRATELDPDNGDSWLYLLKFETQFGNAESVESVKQGFKEAEPKHGEAWAAEIKKVSNWRKDPFEVLKGIQISIA